MQVAFISNLFKIQAKGKNKALLISSTGTGKTYAPAFAVRGQNPKKVVLNKLVVAFVYLNRGKIEKYLFK